MKNYIKAAPENRGRQLLHCLRSVFLIVVATKSIFGFEAAAAEDLRPISAHDLVSIRDIGGSNLSVIDIFGALSVSPNKNYIAFQMQVPIVEERSFELYWLVAETRSNGKTWRVGNGGEVILNQSAAPVSLGSRHPVKAQWSPDSKWIYYLKKTNDNTQIWRSQIHSQLSEKVTQDAGDVISFLLSDDGERIFFVTTKPKQEIARDMQFESDRGFLFDDRFHPQRSKKPIAKICELREGGLPQIVGINRACEPALRVVDISSKIEREATHEEAEIYNRRQSANTPNVLTSNDRILLDSREDGSTIWLENNNPKKFSGFRPLQKLHASLKDTDFSCNATECLGYKGIIEHAWWRPGGKEVIFQRADGSNRSMSGLYSWIPGANQIRAIILTEDQLGDCKILSFNAICLLEQWTRPGKVVSIDLDSGEIETIFDPNPEFDKIKFSKIEKYEWEDEFGNPTHGHLVYPLNYEQGRRYPLVITTYRSRGFLRGAVGNEYPIHLLAANGFMVLSHDMPTSWRRDAVLPVVISQFHDNYERRSTLSAQEKILDILNQRGLIDSDRVAITGLSNGAEQAKYGIVHTNRFATAIVSAAFDYVYSFYAKNHQQRVAIQRWLGGPPEKDTNGLYRALSFGLNADQVNAPLLVNVSDHELLGSVEPFARLQDAGKPIEMYVFPGEYHIKWQPQHRLAVYRRNVQWLKFWLMSEEEDDPVSPGQYERWREMRNQRCSWDEPENEKPTYCVSATVK